jgi:hypothetical protein
MTKMTHRTNLIVVARVVNLNTSRIYNYNHMVIMDKISSNEISEGKSKGNIYLWGLIWTNFIRKVLTHINFHLWANLWKNLETTHS